MNKLLLRLKLLTIVITKAKFKSRKRVKFFAPTRHPKSSGNRNFAVWTLAVGFYRLRVKGEGAEDRCGWGWGMCLKWSNILLVVARSPRLKLLRRNSCYPLKAVGQLKTFPRKDRLVIYMYMYGYSLWPISVTTSIRRASQLSGQFE
jgi:hypothetical protein